MKTILIKMIKFYQKAISPHKFFHCIYIPTCSEYTIEAIEKYGGIKGSWMGFKRVLRCNPFAKGGYDPVP